MPIIHKYTVICDEVRREDNGKMILIGVYNTVMIVPQIPFPMASLTFFSVYDVDRPGQWSMKFKLQHLETGHSIAEGHGGLNKNHHFRKVRRQPDQRSLQRHQHQIPHNGLLEIAKTLLAVRSLG